jgi:hypothetical protein
VEWDHPNAKNILRPFVKFFGWIMNYRYALFFNSSL